MDPPAPISVAELEVIKEEEHPDSTIPAIPDSEHPDIAQPSTELQKTVLTTLGPIEHPLILQCMRAELDEMIKVTRDLLGFKKTKLTLNQQRQRKLAGLFVSVGHFFPTLKRGDRTAFSDEDLLEIQVRLLRCNELLKKSFYEPEHKAKLQVGEQS